MLAGARHLELRAANEKDSTAVIVLIVALRLVMAAAWTLIAIIATVIFLPFWLVVMLCGSFSKMALAIVR